MLWNDIFSNSTTKQEEMCEKLLCCFMLPVGTIALVGISTWQNPLISPHKTTSYIPLGYYSNWVILISLYIVLLPSQSCLYILHSFAFQCSVWVCLHASCLCPHVMYLFAPLWGKKKKIGAIRTAGSDVFFPPRIKSGGWCSPSHSLSFCPSICPSVDHLNCQTAQFQQSRRHHWSVISANDILCSQTD